MTGGVSPAPSGRALATGMAWIGGFRWSAQVLTWAATLVVIRLLAPTDYGIVGMALTWIGIASVLAEFGLGTAIVALPSLDDRQAAQLNTVALGLGALAAAISLAGAGIIAGFFREPALELVIPALSLLFVLEALRIVPMAQLARRLDYRRLATIDFARAVGSAASVLLLALLGYGYWALVVGTIAGQVIASTWAVIRMPAGWARPVAGELVVALRYSRHILVNRLAWQGYINADFLVVGRLFGAELLGFFSVARNLASLPGEKLGNVVTAASAPFFASIQHDRAALRHYFLRITEALTVVLHPILIGFLLVADLAIPLVIGERWNPSITPMRILVGAAALQTIFGPVGQILNVTGHTRTGMWSSIIALGVLAPAFVAGALLGGIHGVALAWLVTFPLVIALPLATTLRALDLSLSGYLAAWQRAFEGVAVMAGAVGLVRFGLARFMTLAPVVELLLAIVAGAVAYLAVIVVRHGDLVAAVRSLIRGPSTPQGGTPGDGPSGANPA